MAAVEINPNPEDLELVKGLPAQLRPHAAQRGLPAEQGQVAGQVAQARQLHPRDRRLELVEHLRLRIVLSSHGTTVFESPKTPSVPARVHFRLHPSSPSSGSDALRLLQIDGR